MRYFLTNDRIKVEIDSFGAEIKSVINRNNMREYMWYGDPKFWGRTSPVLFPFVGSLKDKKYSWNGVEYPMGQHGFARDNEFDLIRQTDDEIWFSFKSNEATLAKYPFEFELQIGYKIVSKNETDDVSVMWKVLNPASETMYFSIGAHPAFLCPFHGYDRGKNNCKTGYKLFFEGTDTIHHHGNDVAKGLAIREDIEMPLDNGYVTITDTRRSRQSFSTAAPIWLRAGRPIASASRTKKESISWMYVLIRRYLLSGRLKRKMPPSSA